MNLRDRLGLYGSYFCGMCGIGFTLPYLAPYLAESKGMSDRAIGIVSTLAALAGLAQFPVGLWSDQIGRRKPFLVVALAAVAGATWFLPSTQGAIGVSVLIILFAENGIGRAVVESLSGAEAAALASKGEVGSALGRLRFWKPTGIILLALGGSVLARRGGSGSILVPLAVIQSLAVGLAFLLPSGTRSPADASNGDAAGSEHAPEPVQASNDKRSLLTDRSLWAFATAMTLYHAANAPGGVYLSLYLKRDLHAPEEYLAYAFAVSMAAWMLVVGPAGRLADRWGRRPLLIAGWAIMALRLALVAVIGSPALIVVNQALDGLGNGLFAVLAAAWVTDRLADPRRSGEAQVIVGSCLVLGSAVGPALAGFLVGPLGYRGLFWVLSGVGVLATAIVIALVPETLTRPDDEAGAQRPGPMATTDGLSTTP